MTTSHAHDPHQDSPEAAVLRMKAEAVRRLAARQHVDLDPSGVARDAGLDPVRAEEFFPDRDSLLTTLVLDAYNAMGDSAERAATEAEKAGADRLGRWTACWEGVRGWALAHPEEYVLIWGRPVPGYSAPPETMAAGARTVLVLLGVVREALQAGELAVDHVPAPALSEGMARTTETLAGGLLSGLPAPVIARMLIMWTQLHGMVGFEVNGHVAGVAADPGAFFTHAATAMGQYVGLTR
ncbi:TetR-like C-terminal domain-containing protein [Streptomyces sp. TG1A-8]|uniref:TetR-like C-terminal domain-containing protein n=1 Tax=Streptomyces sp. TG1A-8 TaxID=3051385 RepID=UPI00265BACCD|nr:TetR-like C-terminal domain-containing protein [Streptomyces sp. TG1A-8]MDO0924152.1 TetR-like C-terminal domain-containing protein [Streptomyces sp. TG1A-8]